MFLRIAGLCCLLAMGATAVAPAQMSMPAASPAALSGKPTAAERPFVDGIAHDLEQRFASADEAVKAGYIRYTDEDDTGAISYANRVWTSVDPKHPSQLWYDVHGHLLGADFSVLQKDYPDAPTLWGVDPRRWVKIPNHVHYGLAGPNGTVIYGHIGAKKFAAAGGNLADPKPADLVSAGVVKNPKDVRFLFDVPANWDLIVWIVPNPSGAFAEANPNVKPSSTHHGGDM